uniref:Glycosyltransferase n=1 Tax=viral metagenome TaxID=1070528 RepID=A0A6C0DRU6_9ZZZZ
MTKILTLVTSCYPHRGIWQTIHDRDPDAIILCGYPLETNYKLENKILYLNCDDTYGGLPEKIICALDAVLQIEEFKNYTHILKCDDKDLIVSKKTLTEEHIKIIEKSDYAGQKINYIEGSGPNSESKLRHYHYGRVSLYSKWFNRPYRDKWVDYASGTAYVLSRRALSLISRTYSAKDKETISDNYIYEALMIGQILHRHAILPVKLPDVLVGSVIHTRVLPQF